MVGGAIYSSLSRDAQLDNLSFLTGVIHYIFLAPCSARGLLCLNSIQPHAMPQHITLEETNLLINLIKLKAR